MINYPVGDFLIQIKNAALAGGSEVNVRSSKKIAAVAKVMKQEGYLRDVKLTKDRLITNLAYRKKQPVLMELKLVSRPGLRIYKKADEIAGKKGPSILLISTSKGVVSSNTAIKNNAGGEVIAEVL